MADWLFIADLHLAPQRPGIIRLFERFADEIAIHAERLYILGDFLEYWVGDDDPGHGLETAFSALNRLHQAGVDVFFMHGNRDFLIGEELARRCQFTLVHEPLVESIKGESCLLMHGDVLCTDDLEYQQFRAMVRNSDWQSALLNKPLEERQLLAHSLREKSRAATADKAEDIMDVNQQAVCDTMRQHAVNLLIHGHTHRPAIHEFELNGEAAKRIVLGDWYASGSYLRINDKAEARLISFD